MEYFYSICVKNKLQFNIRYRNNAVKIYSGTLSFFSIVVVLYVHIFFLFLLPFTRRCAQRVECRMVFVCFVVQSYGVACVGPIDTHTYTLSTIHGGQSVRAPEAHHFLQSSLKTRRRRVSSIQKTQGHMAYHTITLSHPIYLYLSPYIFDENDEIFDKIRYRNNNNNNNNRWSGGGYMCCCVAVFIYLFIYLRVDGTPQLFRLLRFPFFYLFSFFGSLLCDILFIPF